MPQCVEAASVFYICSTLISDSGMEVHEFSVEKISEVYHRVSPEALNRHITVYTHTLRPVTLIHKYSLGPQ